MNLRKHHHVILVLVIVVILYIVPFKHEITAKYGFINWAEMSISIGAAILTLVGIITSIVISNENTKRGGFSDDLTFVMNKTMEKTRYNPDRRLSDVYNNSERIMREVIEDRSPLEYSDGNIGILSFFFFLVSALLALENVFFKWIYGSFLIGVALLVGYVVYCILTFKKIDEFSRLPDIEGTLTLLSVRINGEALPFDIESREPEIRIPPIIRRMEFGLRFEGKKRNGFFHSVIRYTNGQSTHIPEPNTYLGDTVFADGRILVISPDKRLDTGILQNNGPVEIIFELCRDLTENPQIRELVIPRLGERGTRVHGYCSIPNDFQIESIELRIFEDPLFISSYKRREIDIITVRPERT